MNTSHKCEAILKKIIEEVNKNRDKDYYVKFMSDIGKQNATTIFYEIEGFEHCSHSHFGGFSHSWNQLVDEMYKFFCKD